MSKNKFIGIIDYQAGNISSLKNSILEIGYKPVLIKNSTEIKQFSKIILPGVGSFQTAIENLKKNKIDEALRKFTNNKENKLLGICLGMQLLFENSEETTDIDGKVDGLSFLKGRVLQFSKKKRKMNIGWCLIKSSKKFTLTKEIHEKNKIFYFVHGYYCKSENNLNICSETIFEKSNFISAVEKDNIFGVQFHPEKSLDSGLKLLKNFCKL